MRRSHPQLPMPSLAHRGQVWDLLPALLRCQASPEACRSRRKRSWVGAGHTLAQEARTLGNGVWKECRTSAKKSRDSGKPLNHEVPSRMSLESLPPRTRHSLGYAGTDEGHSNSATRRTKDFMGIDRSTPPCDGNVLGAPGRVPKGRNRWASAADRATSGPWTPRNGCR